MINNNSWALTLFPQQTEINEEKTLEKIKNLKRHSPEFTGHVLAYNRTGIAVFGTESEDHPDFPSISYTLYAATNSENTVRKINCHLLGELQKNANSSYERTIATSVEISEPKWKLIVVDQQEYFLNDKPARVIHLTNLFENGFLI